jgi:hypothetical protein
VTGEFAALRCWVLAARSLWANISLFAGAAEAKVDVVGVEAEVIDRSGL